LYGRGFAYNEKGVKDKDGDLYDKAIQDLTESLKLSPKYVPALYVRGVAYRNKARLKMNDMKLLALAIMDFNQAIELNPNHANAYYGRGLAYRAKGDKARGDADIKKARQIDPKVGEAPDG
jgi:tetratricopeptide (TPR) repeat protein